MGEEPGENGKNVWSLEMLHVPNASVYYQNTITKNHTVGRVFFLILKPQISKPQPGFIAKTKIHANMADNMYLSVV